MSELPKPQDNMNTPIPESAITDPAMAEEMAYAEKPHHELAAAAHQLGLEDDAIAQKAKAILAGEDAGYSYLDEQQARLDEQRRRLGGGESVAEDTAEIDPKTIEAKELLLGQLDIAYRGQVDTVGALNTGKDEGDKIKPASSETLTSEFETWLTPDKLSYIAKQIEAGRVPHLLATRNVQVDSETLLQAAEQFAKGQPDSRSYRDIINQCTPAELSGTNPNSGNQVHFNVVFEDFDKDLYGTVAEQKAALTRLQTENPFLEAPSMLKSLTYLFTLRAERGGQLSGDGTFDSTFNRDYTLEPKSFGGGLCVPFLIVIDCGTFIVGDSFVRNDRVGRALVG